MKISGLPRAVLRAQYQLARIPLQLIEDRVVTRIPNEAPARLLYERSLGKLDSSVGAVLNDPELADRGAALVERSDTRARAAELDATAEARKQQADAKLKSARDEAVEARQEAQDATAQEIKEAREAADKRKQDAAESARQRSAAAKQHADEAAAKQKQAVESARERTEQRTKAAEKAVSKVAESKLDDAADKRSEAASKRVQADKSADLAHAEKEKRRNGQANT
jgi:hypothetical protein